MKNILFIFILLSMHFSYSQIENNSNALKPVAFEVNIEELHYREKNLFPDIIKLEIKDLKNNSEGKFSLNPVSKKYFKSDLNKNKTSILKNKSKKSSNLKTDNINTSINKTFINEIIRNKIAEEIKNYINLSEALTYGDRNIEQYKYYNELEISK